MKNPKLGLLILVLLLLPFVLGACGGVDLGSPKSAAESFYRAIENKNEDDLKEVICDELEGAFDSTIATFDDDNDIEIDYDFTLEFAEKEDDSDDDEAIVEVYGRVKVRFVDDDIDREVKMGSRNDAPLAEIRLVKDGDDWKVCDTNVLPELFD